MQDRTNSQITTRWAEAEGSTLTTELTHESIRALHEGEILVEMLFVPMHGSFWLATHPEALHPRKKEFLSKGKFVFGNGGVGRVVETYERHSHVRVGDYVTIFGHVPCRVYDCYACNTLHRYTECDYGEAGILGHGKDAGDGTYAKYCILPPYSYEICYRAEEKPDDVSVQPFMFSFLLADVRNALTRHPDTLKNRRMLLLGAGQSGHIAAYIHLHSCPEAKIVVVDPNPERLASIKKLDPRAIETYLLTPEITRAMDMRISRQVVAEEVNSVITGVVALMRKHFNGRVCNLLFDSSSGNTSQIWDNPRVLSPSTHCIPFGFASESIVLSKELIQLSGLNLLTSRGVGNLRNRREVVELIKAGASEFIMSFLCKEAQHLRNLNEAISFVDAQYKPPKALFEIPHAYITPSPCQNHLKL